ncbi:MAG: hypothetical protein KAI53_00710 [Candidatus Aenigmarchaeota archaeon]|nr:hypothetical protein [Candidatus Aenigmarchaeota archaeon]
MFYKLLKLFVQEKKEKPTACIKTNTKKQYFAKNNIKKIITEKNQPYVLAFLAIIILLAYSKAAIVIPLFIGIAAVSRLSQNLFPFVAGFDLCLFLTVLSAVAYGSLVGLIVGIGSGFLGAIIRNSRRMEDKLVFYLGMGAVGFFVPHLPVLNIVTLGLIATAVYDLLIVTVYFGVIRKCIINATTFAATHFAFNWWLFSMFGATILALL